MSAHDGLPFLGELILFLALAGVLIPLLQRRAINPVLGFLALGAIVGPHGVGRFVDTLPWLSYLSFSEVDHVAVFAELGVVFLMFMIGLEMSIDRLWAMRRWVFGVGTLQVLLSALALGVLSHHFGNSMRASVVLGLTLALSSTAVVMQLLTLRRELGTPLGQASFSVLLLQDLAVVPLLVLVSIMGQEDGGSFLTQLGQAGLKAALTVAAIYLIGRRVIRPLFHLLAANRQADTFMALTLLTSLGVAALTWHAGLSMALGALLAGLIIAETEFRHAVEVTIEPFKELLMGLFFMSVGMGIDVTELLAQPLWLPLSVVGLILIKGLIVFVLFRLSGLSYGRAVEGGLLLGSSGEFAFIVIGMALGLGLLTREVGQFMLLVVGFGMLATPLAARLGQTIGTRIDRWHGTHDAESQLAETGDTGGYVLLAGYGRTARLIGTLLDEQGVRYRAIERDAAIVARYRARGLPVVFGDIGQPQILQRLHLADASAVVLTMDHSTDAIHAVIGIRKLAPTVCILARARDEQHALALRQAGADMVFPETLETALQLTGGVLASLGVPDEAALAALAQARDARTHPLQVP